MSKTSRTICVLLYSIKLLFYSILYTYLYFFFLYFNEDSVTVFFCSVIRYRFVSVVVNLCKSNLDGREREIAPGNNYYILYKCITIIVIIYSIIIIFYFIYVLYTIPYTHVYNVPNFIILSSSSSL